MNAITAEPSATTQKTLSTDIAPGAESSTPKRIDECIAEYFKKANSEEFSTVNASAQIARRHGFTTCANSRYADFLAEYQATPLRAHYEEHYPSCVFLPWGAFRNLLTALDLWCELPQFYAGAIPPEQLPWLDLFALSSSDEVAQRDLVQLFHPNEVTGIHRVLIDRIAYGSDGFNRDPLSERDWHWLIATQKGIDLANDMRDILKQFSESWFVIAPKEAFTTKDGDDFIGRAKKILSRFVTAKTDPPNDPLVIRFVRGGCLVVAAWGDEAAHINAAAVKLRA